MSAPSTVPHMSSAPEYNLRELGPWRWCGEEAMTLWAVPDPFGTPTDGIYYEEETGRYTNERNEPIRFADTEPQFVGFPPLEDEAELGNPRVQWERAH